MQQTKYQVCVIEVLVAYPEILDQDRKMNLIQKDNKKVYGNVIMLQRVSFTKHIIQKDTVKV